MMIVCDFDGTVTEVDTLHLVVERYAPRTWMRVERELRRGTITLVEALEEEFRHVCASEREVVEHVLAGTGVRPGFRELVDWAERSGHELLVVSAGFRTLIDPVLARDGFCGLHVHAGDALFTTEGTRLMFPPSGMSCADKCGHCKKETIAAHAPFSGPVVYIGDGYSDHCAAQSGDVIFARRSLAAHLDREGVGYTHFSDFWDVLDVLADGSSELPAGVHAS